MTTYKRTKKKINRSTALARYEGTGRTRSTSKQGLSKREDPTGRVDILTGFFASKLIRDIGNDLGFPSLHEELNPLVQDRLKVLKKYKVPSEVMAIGRAVMRDRAGK